MMVEIQNPNQIIENDKKNSRGFLNSVLIFILSLLVGGLIVWAGVRSDVENMVKEHEKMDVRITKVEEKHSVLESCLSGQLGTIIERLNGIDKRLEKIEGKRK